MVSLSGMGRAYGQVRLIGESTGHIRLVQLVLEALGAVLGGFDGVLISVGLCDLVHPIYHPGNMFVLDGTLEVVFIAFDVQAQ